jgi:protease-4
LHGLITIGILAFVGVVLLLGGVFLVTVAVQATNEFSSGFEKPEKTLTEKFLSGNQDAKNKIAIITIGGVITSEEDGFIAKQIRKAQEDTDVKAVVLRIESPGGTMAGSDYYLHLLKKMKSKRDVPIVVSMGSVAASGGYYVSMIGDEIYAEPSTITGSIGVIVSLFNGSELCKKIGIESTPITSGPHKAMGSFAKPMSEEERVIWQRLVDDSCDRFKKIIRDSRKEFARNPEDLDKLATGQIYTANEAVENKLIDKIGFIDDAVERAQDLADLTSRDCKTIRYKPKQTLTEILLEGRSPNKLLSGETLSEVTTPKVYLLCPHVIPAGD